MSNHFTVGAKVKIHHLPPALVIDRADVGRYTVIVVQHEDGTQECLFPYALNRN